ncbi:MAG: response regulator [bacterium]|nr:response regulator [bacterium]
MLRRLIVGFVFLLWLALPVAFLYPLDPGKELTQYVLDGWELEHGLPQNSVFDIIQTRDGYLWLGTQEGLVRFDGVHFTVFNKGNVRQLRSSWVWDLYEDTEGTLWIGFYGGGLARLENGELKALDGFSYDKVTGILEDREGVMWFGTFGDGVIRLEHPGKGDAWRSTSTAYTTEHGLADDRVNALCEDREGRLWIATAGGLSCLENGGITTYTQEDGLAGGRVTAVYEDRKGNLWVGTNGGLNLLEGGKFKNHTTKDGLHGVEIRAIYEDRAGNLWLGTVGKGLCRLTDGKLTSLTKTHGLSDDVLWSIYEDREGSLWIGNNTGGLNRLKDGKFTTFSTWQGLPNENVSVIYNDSKGKMLVGSFGGLNFLEQGKFIPFTPPAAFSHEPVSTVYEDRQGTLWIGIYGKGLIRYEPKHGKWRWYTRSDGLPGEYVGTICEDSEGILWLGTWKAGLSRFDPEKEEFTTFPTVEFLKKSIGCIFRSREGDIWIASGGGGLIRLINGKFTVYTTKDGLPTNHVKTIYEDREGDLWLGTDFGLSRLRNGAFTSITPEDGLFDAAVQLILEDHRGDFWMSSNRGIYRANKKELNDVADGKRKTISYTAYDERDGMKKRECNGGQYPGGGKTRDGKLWFPTIEGLVMVDPGNIETNRLPPPVVIEEIKVDNTVSLPPFLTGGEKMILSPSIQRLEIRYTALSFLVPGRVRFKYKLEGFDNDWVDVGTRRTAYYTKPPSGDYTFRVKACNNDGVWNETGASFSFYQAPFFYQTWWFVVLVAAGVLFLAFGIYRFRVRQLKRHEMELEQLVDERTLQLAESNRRLNILNEQLAEQREVADAANQSKSDFLARMSHEIRTPMNGVIGFIEILLDTPLNEEQLEVAETIGRSGDALVNLVNDILDFSRIEAGELSLDPVDFDPELTAFDVCEIVLPRLEDKPVEIVCRIGDNVPPYVIGDAGRFRQVLVNLVGNAVKFIESGEIELSLRVEEEEAERLKVHVLVKDTGIGIPPDKLEAIFNVFQQADSSIARVYGGTGLGLPICKQIAVLMGGDVRAESTPGEGSVFHFTAWVGKSRKKPEKEVTYELLTGKKVLLADDNRTNLDILVHVLKQHRMRVKETRRPERVVPLLREAFAAGDPFDICVIDIRMPGLSGFDVAAAIRGLDVPLSNLPLLAFSSSTIVRSKLFKDSGFDGFLPKPVRRQKLLKMIRRLLSKKGALPPVEGTGEAETGKRLLTRYSIDEEAKHSVHILLAEDNPVNQKLAHFLLTNAGYPLTMVNNGEEAVETYTADPDKFDLIFMDIQMPRMNGLEATKEIRKRFKTAARTIPIIAMTAESMKGDREKFLQAGMNDYISKPIRRELVFEMIKKWVLTNTL